MAKRLLTPEQDAYLRKIAPGKYKFKITELFNEHFGTDFKESQIRTYMCNYGIHNGLFQAAGPGRRTHRLFTDEQTKQLIDEFDGNLDGTYKAVWQFVKEKYGVIVTLMQIKCWLRNHGVRFGHHGKFPKGHVSANRGKKVSLEAYEKMKRTMFSKGHRPVNAVPIGTEVVTEDGYIKVKIADPHTWKLKQRLIWEQLTGEKLTRHEKILFLDGNKQNLEIDNLAKVSGAELSQLNLRGWHSDNPEVTLAYLHVVKLRNAITEARRREKENGDH